MKRIIRIMTIITTVVAIGFTALLLYNQFGIHRAVIQMPEENVKVIAAPEQTMPMEHETFKKEKYVPWSPTGVNLAVGGKMEADSFTDVYVPQKAIDGNAAGQSYWEAQKNSYPNVLTLKLQKKAPVHAIRLCLCPQSIWGKRTQDFLVETSVDGETYEELIPREGYEFNPDTGNEVVLEFDSREAEYVRLKFYANTGAGGAQVAELEVYGE